MPTNMTFTTTTTHTGVENSLPPIKENIKQAADLFKNAQPPSTSQKSKDVVVNLAGTVVGIAVQPLAAVVYGTVCAYECAKLDEHTPETRVRAGLLRGGGAIAGGLYGSIYLPLSKTTEFITNYKNYLVKGTGRYAQVTKGLHVRKDTQKIVHDMLLLLSHNTLEDSNDHTRIRINTGHTPNEQIIDLKNVLNESNKYSVGPVVIKRVPTERQPQPHTYCSAIKKGRFKIISVSYSDNMNEHYKHCAAQQFVDQLDKMVMYDYDILAIPEDPSVQNDEEPVGNVQPPPLPRQGIHVIGNDLTREEQIIIDQDEAEAANDGSLGKDTAGMTPLQQVVLKAIDYLEDNLSTLGVCEDEYRILNENILKCKDEADVLVEFKKIFTDSQCEKNEKAQSFMKNLTRELASIMIDP